MVENESIPDPLEGFSEWEAFDPADVAPPDYGFEGSCTGETEEETDG
jgi:hypothetical protein